MATFEEALAALRQGKRVRRSLADGQHLWSPWMLRTDGGEVLQLEDGAPARVYLQDAMDAPWEIEAARPVGFAAAFDHMRAGDVARSYLGQEHRWRDGRFEYCGGDGEWRPCGVHLDEVTRPWTVEEGRDA